jgi:uncharacterized membrane protein YvbJ
MAKCWNCGADVPDSATFCPSCGKTFAATSPGMPQPAQPYSPGPQYPNPPGIYPPMQNSQLERKVDTIQKIVIAIIVLQVLFLILAFA